MGQISRKLIKQCFTKGIQISQVCHRPIHSTNTAQQHTKHTAALGQVKLVFSGEKAKFPAIKTLTPSRSWPQSHAQTQPRPSPESAQTQPRPRPITSPDPDPDRAPVQSRPSKSAPGRGHRTSFPLSFYQDHCESLGRAWHSAHLIQLQVLVDIPIVIF